MFDFGALPPEINSARIYSGPGSAPMMAAASAWDGLAAELSSAAAGYNLVVTELTSAPWVGPASRAMMSAVVPYVTWIGAMSGQAEDTASQARAAAAAYETTFMLMVPPPVIAANRVLLASLVATNFFGQNTPAIAATEADYMEMWAQDAAAMYGYAASSAIATALGRFSSPPNTTSQDAVGNQSAAVAQASSTPAGDSAQTVTSTIPQLLSSASLPQAAQHLTAAAATPTLLQEIQGELQAAYNKIVGTIIPTPDTWWWQVTPAGYTAIIKQTLQAYFGVGVGNFGWSIGQQTTFGLTSTVGSGGAPFATPQFAGLGAGGWGFHAIPNLGGGAAAGAASKVGALSVPASWEGAAPGGAERVTAQLVSANLPVSPGDANAANGMNAALRGFPVTGARGAQRAGNAGVRYGFRYSVLTRPPSAG